MYVTSFYEMTEYIVSNISCRYPNSVYMWGGVGCWRYVVERYVNYKR